MSTPITLSPPITITVDATGKLVITPGTPSPPALAGDFVFAPPVPTIGEVVTFSQSASGGVPPYSYMWTFGDGSISTGAGPVTHVYTASGTYIVTLVITDSTGTKVAVVHSINAGLPPSVLTGDFTYSPSAPTTIQSTTFTATVAGGTAPFTFAWNFGDGTTDTGQTLSHPYPTAGTFIVNMTVTDAAGSKATATHSVTVTAPTPPPIGNYTLNFEGFDWDGGGEETLTLNDKLLASLPTSNNPSNEQVYIPFVVSIPSSMLVQGTNTLTFTHAPWDCGVDDNVKNLVITDPNGQVIFSDSTDRVLNCTTEITYTFNIGTAQPPPPPGTQNTVLTIAAAPNPSTVGQVVTVVGHLLTTSGVVVPAVPIVLQQSTDNGVTWTVLGTTSTLVDGSYTVSVSFTTAGTYQLRTLFAGA